MAVIKKIIIRARPIFYPLSASFIIAFCWNWYHLTRHPWNRWFFLFLLAFVLLTCGYALGRRLLIYLSGRWHKKIFTRREFLLFLDELYFFGSWLFLIFLSRHEFLNLILFSLILFLIFWRVDRFLARGAFNRHWREVGRSLSLLGFFIFAVSAFFQYFAYAYYILDANIKFYNIVLFRSWAMTMFWLFGFSLSGIIYHKFSGRIKNLFIIFWALAFLASMFFGLVNVGVLYYSGLYFSPVVLGNAGGGGLANFYEIAILLGAIFFLLTGSFIFIFKKYIRVQRLAEKRPWSYYNFAVIILAIFSFASVASLKNTPEALILKSFWNEWRGNDRPIELSPLAREKLARFGLTHDLDSFYLNHHEQVFDAPITHEFDEEKPNVVILFLESFSARLTGVYNSRFPDLTPALVDFADHPRTTVFKNYYNASTPTITGLISQLCSFLPPTGHEEIEKDKKLQKHYLFCLPQALKESGYGATAYFTAVEKDFANKDTIMASMGVDRVVGEKELSRIISGEPLSWGYSDHQTLPVLWNEMTAESVRPFVFIWSSVDSHPPFDRVKDVVKYGTGGNRVLNSVQTTDDAFGVFWREFQQSEFYDNTILVVVADHTIFPSAYDRRDFPEEAGQINYYDESVFIIYTPAEILPAEVDTLASGIDFTPTLLHLLNINPANTFEGHSIFADRSDYPNILGMHEFGLFINENLNTDRKISYAVPNDLACATEKAPPFPDSPLTLCEYFNYFVWKRQAFEQGRFWRPPQD